MVVLGGRFPGLFIHDNLPSNEAREGFFLCLRPCRESRCLCKTRSDVVDLRTVHEVSLVHLVLRGLKDSTIADSVSSGVIGGT